MTSDEHLTKLAKWVKKCKKPYLHLNYAERTLLANLTSRYVPADLSRNHLKFLIHRARTLTAERVANALTK